MKIIAHLFLYLFFMRPLMSMIIQSNFSLLLRITTSLAIRSCSIYSSYFLEDLADSQRSALLSSPWTLIQRLVSYFITNSQICWEKISFKFYLKERDLSYKMYRYFPKLISLRCGGHAQGAFWSTCPPKQTRQAKEIQKFPVLKTVSGRIQFLCVDNFLAGSLAFSRQPRALYSDLIDSNSSSSYGIVACLMYLKLFRISASARFWWIWISRGQNVSPRLRTTVLTGSRLFSCDWQANVNGSFLARFKAFFILLSNSNREQHASRSPRIPSTIRWRQATRRRMKAAFVTVGDCVALILNDLNKQGESEVQLCGRGPEIIKFLERQLHRLADNLRVDPNRVPAADLVLLRPAVGLRRAEPGAGVRGVHHPAVLPPLLLLQPRDGEVQDRRDRCAQVEDQARLRGAQPEAHREKEQDQVLPPRGQREGPPLSQRQLADLPERDELSSRQIGAQFHRNDRQDQAQMELPGGEDGPFGEVPGRNAEAVRRPAVHLQPVQGGHLTGAGEEGAQRVVVIPARVVEGGLEAGVGLGRQLLLQRACDGAGDEQRQAEEPELADGEAELGDLQLVHSGEGEAEREGGGLPEGEHHQGVQHLHPEHQGVQGEQQQGQGAAAGRLEGRPRRQAPDRAGDREDVDQVLGDQGVAGEQPHQAGVRRGGHPQEGVRPAPAEDRAREPGDQDLTGAEPHPLQLRTALQPPGAGGARARGPPQQAQQQVHQLPQHDGRRRREQVASHQEVLRGRALPRRLPRRPLTPPRLRGPPAAVRQPQEERARLQKLPGGGGEPLQGDERQPLGQPGDHPGVQAEVREVVERRGAVEEGGERGAAALLREQREGPQDPEDVREGQLLRVQARREGGRAPAAAVGPPQQLRGRARARLQQRRQAQPGGGAPPRGGVQEAAPQTQQGGGRARPRRALPRAGRAQGQALRRHQPLPAGPQGAHHAGPHHRGHDRKRDPLRPVRTGARRGREVLELEPGGRHGGGPSPAAAHGLRELHREAAEHGVRRGSAAERRLAAAGEGGVRGEQVHERGGAVELRELLAEGEPGAAQEQGGAEDAAAEHLQGEPRAVEGDGQPAARRLLQRVVQERVLPRVREGGAAHQPQPQEARPRREPQHRVLQDRGPREERGAHQAYPRAPQRDLPLPRGRRARLPRPDRSADRHQAQGQQEAGPADQAAHQGVPVPHPALLHALQPRQELRLAARAAQTGHRLQRHPRRLQPRQDPLLHADHQDLHRAQAPQEDALAQTHDPPRPARLQVHHRSRHHPAQQVRAGPGKDREESAMSSAIPMVIANRVYGVSACGGFCCAIVVIEYKLIYFLVNEDWQLSYNLEGAAAAGDGPLSARVDPLLEQLHGDDGERLLHELGLLLLPAGLRLLLQRHRHRRHCQRLPLAPHQRPPLLLPPRLADRQRARVLGLLRRPLLLRRLQHLPAELPDRRRDGPPAADHLLRRAVQHQALLALLQLPDHAGQPAGHAAAAEPGPAGQHLEPARHAEPCLQLQLLLARRRHAHLPHPRLRRRRTAYPHLDRADRASLPQKGAQPRAQRQQQAGAGGLRHLALRGADAGAADQRRGQEKPAELLSVPAGVRLQRDRPQDRLPAPLPYALPRRVVRQEPELPHVQDRPLPREPPPLARRKDQARVADRLDHELHGRGGPPQRDQEPPQRRRCN